MPSTHTAGSSASHASPPQSEFKSARMVAQKSSQKAIEEINSYIAIRDGLLAQAEKVPTSEALRRAGLANELVGNYLQAARSPYEGQALPEADARRERERCAVVKARLAALAAIRH